MGLPFNVQIALMIVQPHQRHSSCLCSHMPVVAYSGEHCPASGSHAWPCQGGAVPAGVWGRCQCKDSRRKALFCSCCYYSCAASRCMSLLDMNIGCQTSALDIQLMGNFQVICCFLQGHVCAEAATISDRKTLQKVLLCILLAEEQKWSSQP